MKKSSHLQKRPASGDIAGKARRDRRIVRAVMRAVQSHFADKKAKLPLELALRTAAHPRNAEKWLAGGGMDAENFAELIQSDLGRLVIEAVMGPDEARWPSWYRGFRRQVQLSELRRGLAAQHRALAQLETEGV